MAAAAPAAGSAFDAHAPAEGFRLRGAAKLAFVTEARPETSAPSALQLRRRLTLRVAQMFDRVAPKYDAVNLLISLGQARAASAAAPAPAHGLTARGAQTTLWRVLALAFLPRVFRRDAAVLDVGCGART